MGQEAYCRVIIKEETDEGKALLETDFLTFRGSKKIKLLFSEMTSVEAESGSLHITTSNQNVVFELGECASKWKNKILNPSSLPDKLGLKAGMTVGLIDMELHFNWLPEGFEYSNPNENEGEKYDCVFLGIEDRYQLLRIVQTEKKLKPKGALWVVYPKGLQCIREIEVIEAGRDIGLKDVKVVRFSTTHTALKFVIPVDRR